MHLRRRGSAFALTTATGGALLSVAAMTLIGGCQGGRSDQFSNVPPGAGGPGNNGGNPPGGAGELQPAANFPTGVPSRNGLQSTLRLDVLWNMVREFDMSRLLTETPTDAL